MSMIFLDTETCGLHGMAVLLQYAKDDGPLELWDIWTNPIVDTLELIEQICDDDVCGFNLAFDWFHLCKIWTTFRLAPRSSWVPADHIDALALLEEKARFSDFCLKPKRACDLMLLARKTHFQSLMNRDDIRIKRVPTPLAWKLARELETRIKFADIYFARRKDKDAPRWQVYDIKDREGVVNPDFKDIRLKFSASTALKNLGIHALGIDPRTVIRFGDIEVDRSYWPAEVGYAPFALALSKAPSWRTEGGKFTWPGVIYKHIEHWSYNERARKYAGDDVVRYTRPLWEYFKRPTPGDDDSELACCVAAVRWKGFAVDIPRLKRLKAAAEDKIASVPTNPKQARIWLWEVLSEEERVVATSLADSTKRTVLEEICRADEWKGHPVVERARAILDARFARKEIELYDKLLRAGRFHASFKVIGTLSNRMSGTDGLNPQAIKKDIPVREAFSLAEADPIILELEIDGATVRVKADSYTLLGGDFESFEVAIAEAVFQCPSLREALTSGLKIHAMFGIELFPGATYEEVCQSKGAVSPRIDMYDKGKKGVFLIFYGGNDHTIVVKLGIAPEIAAECFNSFFRKHKEIGEFQVQVQKDFGCLEQPKGIGTRINWVEPKDYAESFLGFRRYFTLENKVCRALFDLAQDPPKDWRTIKLKVQRRERLQTAVGAVASALYAGAFGIASRNVRAAKNHFIQSPGAQITKSVQRAIWDIQPSGIHPFVVRPANVHDEFLCPTRKGFETKVTEVVKAKVETYRSKIPLIEIDWNVMKTWADKEPVRWNEEMQVVMNHVTGEINAERTAKEKLKRSIAENRVVA